MGHTGSKAPSLSRSLSRHPPSPSSINLYQRRVGSILYAAVITRVDIAFAASRLSRFTMNPGEQHHAAAEHLLRYMLGTKTLALEPGGGDSLDTWSDASFADNTLDRKSSQVYVMKLFGGVIRWRANKTTNMNYFSITSNIQPKKPYTKQGINAGGMQGDTTWAGGYGTKPAPTHVGSCMDLEWSKLTGYEAPLSTLPFCAMEAEAGLEGTMNQLPKGAKGC